MKTKLASLAPPVVIAFSFLLSRLLYIRAGLQFDNTPPKYFYQFIDPQLLKTRFLESVWYLHSQPPLLNFVTGLLYQRFSPQSKIFSYIFLILGFLFALTLYWLGLRLGIKPWASAALAIWFTVSPATAFYENMYFYTYPVAFLLVLAALVLSKFLETDNAWWGCGFFSLLAGLCLTWAIFHLTWMIATIALIAVWYRNWRKLALVSLIPVLAVTGWYAKNSLLFGTFSASSWVGMNLSHVTFLSPLAPQSVRDDLVRRGDLTPYPVPEAFRAIENYQGLLPVPPPRGIPVLDENIKSTKAVNFNHTYYLALSERMLKDALRFIRSRPAIYLASVKQGLSIYFHSSSDYLLLKDKPAPGLEVWWDRIFYGQVSNYNGDFNNRWNSSPLYVGWWLVIAYAAGTVYGLRTVLAGQSADQAFVPVITFITFTILYCTFTANFFDLGENNRFRFTLDPLVLLLVGRVVQNLLSRSDLSGRRQVRDDLERSAVRR